MKLSSWSCQNRALGNHLHLMSLWLSVGLECVSARIFPLSVLGGRSGSDRKARGGLRADEGEMRPDKCWLEWRRWHEQGGFLVCPLVCPSPNSYLISLHISLAGCEDRPDLIFKPASPIFMTEWTACLCWSRLSNTRQPLIARGGTNIFSCFASHSASCLSDVLATFWLNTSLPLKNQWHFVGLLTLWVGFLVCNKNMSRLNYRCMVF